MTTKQIVALLPSSAECSPRLSGVQLHQETHEAKIGPLELHVQEKEARQLPVWLGVARRRRRAALR